MSSASSAPRPESEDPERPSSFTGGRSEVPASPRGAGRRSTALPATLGGPQPAVAEARRLPTPWAAANHGSVRDVLVVGGAGYVGSVLCQRLIRSGYGVRVLDAFLYGREPLEELALEPGFEIIEGDTRDTTVLAKAMDGVDAVLHLGEIVGDPACSLDPVLTTEVNVTGTRRSRTWQNDSG